jgi:LPXTG-site transpeptidase (sortase) family protein
MKEGNIASKEVSKLALVLTAVAVFLVLLGLFSAFGFVPELKDSLEEGDTKDASGEDLGGELLDDTSDINDLEASVSVAGDIDAASPVRIVIDAIGVDSYILNPESRAVEVLDNALLSGVVRYPGSASVDGDGNMFLFGHSSGRPVVINSAFKVFNRIGDLESGDIIRVASGEKENVYRVMTTRMEEASQVRVDLGGRVKKLTLSTCNSFGSKDDRIVVEAEFIGTYLL